MPGRTRSRFAPLPAAVAVMAALAALALAPEAPAQQGTGGQSCPPAAPVLTGPQTVHRGETYSVSWTAVLKGLLGRTDFYTLERATDPDFTQGVYRVKSDRTSLALPAVSDSTQTLYHRVIAQSGCAGPAVYATSQVLAVKLTDACLSPFAVTEPESTPENPPALTTYVVTWGPGPDAVTPADAPSTIRIRYRVRRTAFGEVKESVSETPSASFSDPPGDYLYQVRAEVSCGTVGPWSPVKRVTVGPAPPGTLFLVSEPAPLVVPPGADMPPIWFAVRNGGTQKLDVEIRDAGAPLSYSEATFSLQPGEVRRVAAALRTRPSDGHPIHTRIELWTPSGSLFVPVDAAAGTGPAQLPVTFDPAQVDVDPLATPAFVTLVNPGSTTASFVSSIRLPWLSVASLDGQPWDRPLAPGERRQLRVLVDRSLRRAENGTEVATISLTTQGQPDATQTLTVVDDGPALLLIPPGDPAGAGVVRSRLLFASLPNAPDLKGVGRFGSDLWITNVDAVSPAQVSLILAPLGEGASSPRARRADVTLEPGETRRFRNLVGRVMGSDGAASLEVRSTAPTVSATALVANTPIEPVVLSRRAQGGQVFSTTVTSGQYGFEMRPTTPGEGARIDDPRYVVTGLAHDARRRTNIILTETTGIATNVEVASFRGVSGIGDAVARFTVTVPAKGSIQISDADLFGPDPISSSPYVEVGYQGEAGTPFGRGGAVVPFATVIDDGTQDASLRVGVSSKALTPIPPADAAATVTRRPFASSTLPFDGAPAPLLLPVVHAPGAAFENGSEPFWKTRVVLTNVSQQEQRSVILRFLGTDGAPRGGQVLVGLGPGQAFTLDDILYQGFGTDAADFGAVRVEASRNADGSWNSNWTDVDVQTETYTADPNDQSRGEFKTGMEGYSYLHGYSSFQSNLGTVQIDGAENSSLFRTNLILQEVADAPCTVAVSAYLPGSFVPLATATIQLAPFAYFSRELFGKVLGLSLGELTDVRVVVRQVDGDGVFMAFASKINLATGDPANIFLRPASAGTGR